MGISLNSYFYYPECRWKDIVISMCVCVCVCMFMCVTTWSQRLQSFAIQMDRTGCERTELHTFCCKNVSLRRYGSFNGLILLHQLTWTADKCRQIAVTYLEFLYLYESCWGLSVSFLKFTCTKTGENNLKTAIPGGDTIFKIFFYQFGCFNLSVETFRQFTPKRMYSSPVILSFFSVCELLLLAQNECYLSKICHLWINIS